MKTCRMSFARFALSASALAVVVGFLFSASSARADSWIFQPSYYTEPTQPVVRIGAERFCVLGGPFYTPPQGAYVRAGWRNSINQIQVGNQTWDQTNVWDSWIQVGAQY
jgi:hypothetical protein